MSDEQSKTAPEKAAAPKAAAPKKAAPKKAEVSADVLRTVAASIDAVFGASTAHHDELKAQLKTTHRLKFRETSERRTYAKMLGFEVGSRGSEMGALQNWANAARRRANEIEAG